MASYRHGQVSFLPQCLLSLLAAMALIDPIVGCLLCRSSLSIDLIIQPSPAPAFEEAVISAPDLSCNKRARKEDTGSDSGGVEEDRHSPRLEPVASKARAEEPARPEAPADAISSPAAATEADPMPAGEITPAGVAMPPPPATEDAVAGNDAAAHASSDPPSQEGTREAIAETTKETPVHAGSLEPPELAAQAPSSPRLTPSVPAAVPALGTGAGVTTGPLLFGLASNSGEAFQGPLTTQVARSEHGETSPAPEVATKDASRGKAPATVAGSSIGSLSSASQL
jgi:hypothetical protein